MCGYISTPDSATNVGLSSTFLALHNRPIPLDNLLLLLLYDTGLCVQGTVSFLLEYCHYPIESTILLTFRQMPYKEACIIIIIIIIMFSSCIALFHIAAQSANVMYVAQI